NVLLLFLFFFFSSRRRHTRSLRDWSSDVCSSDLSSVGSSAHAARDRSASAPRSTVIVPFQRELVARVCQKQAGVWRIGLNTNRVVRGRKLHDTQIAVAAIGPGLPIREYLVDKIPVDSYIRSARIELICDVAAKNNTDV